MSVVPTPVINPVDAPASSPVVVRGGTEPGATVTVYIDNQVVGTTLADQSGAWSLSIPMSSGSHEASACATVTSEWAAPVQVVVS